MLSKRVSGSPTRTARCAMYATTFIANSYQDNSSVSSVYLKHSSNAKKAILFSLRKSDQQAPRDYTLVAHTSIGYTAPAATGIFFHPVAANSAIIAPECAVMEMKLLSSFENMSSNNSFFLTMCSSSVSRRSDIHNMSSSVNPFSISNEGYV